MPKKPARFTKPKTSRIDNIPTIAKAGSVHEFTPEQISAKLAGEAQTNQGTKNKFSERPRKIALVGTSTTSCHEAPYDDPSWQIWNHSGNFLHGKRFDLWFELHTPDVLRESGSIPAYFEFLRKSGDRVMCGHPSKELWPHAQNYPLLDVLEYFPGEYFTSSSAYMIALAILGHVHDKANGGRGIEEIGLWGIDMAVQGEYTHQKACCEYYLGWARGLGIKVTLPIQSPILRCNAMYAFDNLKLSADITGRLKDLNMAKEQMRIQALEAEKKSEYARGLYDGVKQVAEVWSL